MKLQMLKNFVLANPIVSMPHWIFNADQILTTNDEYLINRLLELKAAKIIDKNIDCKIEDEVELAFENKMLKPEYKQNIIRKRGRPKKIECEPEIK